MRGNKRLQGLMLPKQRKLYGFLYKEKERRKRKEEIKQEEKLYICTFIIITFVLLKISVLIKLSVLVDYIGKEKSACKISEK